MVASYLARLLIGRPSYLIHPGIVMRRTGAAVQAEVPVPVQLEAYQSHMKGVDLMDQMIGYYTLSHR